MNNLTSNKKIKYLFNKIKIAIMNQHDYKNFISEKLSQSTMIVYVF